MADHLNSHIESWATQILETIELYRNREAHTALARLQKAHELALNRFGPDHAFTIAGIVLTGAYRLAQSDTRRSLNELRSARQSVDLLFEEQEQQLLLFAAVTGLATIDLVEKNFQQAELLFGKNLAVYEGNPAYQKIDNGAFLIATGEMFFALGKFHEAGIIYDRVISLMKEGRIPAESDVITAANAKRGIIHFMDGSDRLALEELEEALNSFEASNVPPSSLSAACSCAAATIFAKQGNNGSAMNYFLWGLELMDGTYPKGNKILADACNYLSYYCLQQNDLVKAKTFLKQALENLDPLLTPGTTLWSLNHIVQIVREEGNLDELKVYQDRLALVYLETYGDRFPNLEEEETSSESHQRFSNEMDEITKSYRDQMHPQVTAFLQHVTTEYSIESIVSFVQFRAKSALQGNNWSTPAAAEQQGENPLKSASIPPLPGYEGVFDIASTYLDESKPMDALKIMEETLSIIESRKGDNSSDLIPILEAIAHIYDFLGRLSDADITRRRIQEIQIVSL